MKENNMQLSRYPEIWGGIECTIARIGGHYYDQLEAGGHYLRDGDISRLAELNIKAIRYPLLWEKHQPVRDKPIDWAWPDRQLKHIVAEGITPIVGLLHHGSGPNFTDLSQPGFADDLAAYAGLVAERFPWLEYYTPVNEPLTTARFSGLYGLWYPHGKDELACMTMLLNQVKGIGCAMKAIRRVNPAARLVQTEDLSFIHSSPLLAYQADFENCRRWLSFDLLCGKVDRDHRMWSYLMAIGIKDEDLAFFTSNPCPPDILGVNYYVSSERYLDEETDNYPIAEHGGNGRHRYADVAAVRMVAPKGLLTLIEQVWQRYRLPIAITETHINCTREQQLRWLNESWDAACEARLRNIDVRALTPWALIGAYDWDSLLTATNGHYESGAYRIRHGVLELTAVGVLIQSLAKTGSYHHPLLESPGWWLSHRPCGKKTGSPIRPLLILAKAENSTRWAGICHQRGIVCRILPSSSANPNLERWQAILKHYRPWAVIFAADTADPGLLTLSACSRLGVPTLLWKEYDGQNEPAVQHALDLLIDEAIVREQPIAADQLQTI